MMRVGRVVGIALPLRWNLFQEKTKEKWLNILQEKKRNLGFFKLGKVKLMVLWKQLGEEKGRFEAWWEILDGKSKGPS